MSVPGVQFVLTNNAKRFMKRILEKKNVKKWH